ncbi:MAG: hypothetical protein ACO1SV_17710 [Fimbriimonas sp.]
MSAVAVPPTKTFPTRPPIVPPVITNFNGDSGHEEEPYHNLLAEDVRGLLRRCARTHFDPQIDPRMLLRLIDQRKRAIQRELDVHRMLTPEIMPPPFMAAFANDLREDDDVVQTYIRLLSDLDAADERIREEFRAKNVPLPPS